MGAASTEVPFDPVAEELVASGACHNMIPEELQAKLLPMFYSKLYRDIFELAMTWKANGAISPVEAVLGGLALRAVAYEESVAVIQQSVERVFVMHPHPSALRLASLRMEIVYNRRLAEGKQAAPKQC